MKSQANELLLRRGYTLLVDSDELSPFDKTGMIQYLIFQKADRQIEIKQADWRDDYFIYIIEIHGTKLFEIDIRNKETFEAVESTIEKLKQLL